MEGKENGHAGASILDPNLGKCSLEEMALTSSSFSNGLFIDAHQLGCGSDPMTKQNGFDQLHNITDLEVTVPCQKVKVLLRAPDRT
mmetsp:Transcript_106186/g.208256  ORF Transcript_106186/g.208256 Transcript_106186/m.208256 type:complete len:86 (-) Transcript_106186:9-266(-)